MAQKKSQPKSAKKNLSSLTDLNSRSKNSIAKLISLHKKIESSDDRQVIASALFMQKRIVSNLMNEASEGNAIMGLATMKAMVITGFYFQRFYDYQAPYIDNRGYDEITKFSDLKTLVPLMLKYRTIEKADSIAPFVLNLPNLRKTKFTPELFDILNEPINDNGDTFQTTLFNRLKKDYDEAKPELKTAIKNACRVAVFKGYPSAALVYISLLDTPKREALSTQILKGVRLNKFASAQDIKRVSDLLTPPVSLSKRALKNRQELSI